MRGRGGGEGWCLRSMDKAVGRGHLRGERTSLEVVKSHSIGL